MIDINMTILIQMVNFIVAFIIIKYILLVPAVRELTKEQEEQAQTAATIEQLKNANQAKKDTMANRWSACQSTLTNQAPKVVQREKSMLGKEVETAFIVGSPSPDTINPLIEKVSKELTERLSHVR